MVHYVNFKKMFELLRDYNHYTNRYIVKARRLYLTGV